MKFLMFYMIKIPNRITLISCYVKPPYNKFLLFILWPMILCVPEFKTETPSDCTKVWGYSTNEIHDDQVKDDMGKNKVSKSSFWGQSSEVGLVPWVSLNPQAN